MRAVDEIIDAALLEDLGEGFIDITTEALVGDGRASARIVANDPGVIAGLDVAAAVFMRIDPGLSWETPLGDGDVFGAGAVAATLTGRLSGILTAERTALNFLAHLSGIATLTRGFVKAVSGTTAEILDTRKTTPGLRRLEKAAVAAGGGRNHRFGLYDGILIKDNHLVGRDLVEAVRSARSVYPDMRIEVEVDTIEQLHQALAARVDIVLLDNMDIATLRQAIALAKGRAVTEVSGSVDLESIGPIARAGAERISIGALTQSARPIDFSLAVDESD